MKKRYLALFIVSIFCFSLLAIGCGRIPKPSRSQHLIEKHFKKYAKKFSDTIYAESGVKKVEIENQTEIRKDYVSVEAYVILKNENVRKIYATLRKTSIGWKFISWEDATGI
ncbi:MAG: hypothetical protein ABH859_02140 [Pseudomonadota bacterium]